MNHFHADFFVRHFFQRLLHRFHAALHVRLDDEVQILQFALFHLREYVVQRYAALLFDHAFAFFVLAFFLHLFHQALIHSHDTVARIRHVFEAEHGYRHRRARGFHGAAFIVEHGAHSAHRRSRKDVVARMQRTVLHDNARHGALSFIEARFDDRAFRFAIGIRFQFLHFRHEVDCVEQRVDPHTRLSRNGNDHYVAAPFFGNKVVFHKPLFHFVGIHVRFIHFIHRHDDRHVRRFRVIDRLHRLRHDTVVRSHYKHYDIGDFRTARTHRGERRMPRGIDKRNLFAFCRHRVRADTLRDSARFAFRHRRGADFIEKRRFAVIDVPHHRHYGRTRHQFGFVFVLHRIEQHFFRRLFRLVFEVDSEVHGNHQRVFVIDRIVDALHHALFEQAFRNLHGGNAEFFGKHLDGNFLRGDYGMIDFDRRNIRFFRLFWQTKFSVTRLVFVEILHRHALLFLQRITGNGAFFNVRFLEFLLRLRFRIFFRQNWRGRNSRALAGLERSASRTRTGRERLVAARSARAARACGAIRRTIVVFRAGFCHVHANGLTVHKAHGRTFRACGTGDGSDGRYGAVGSLTHNIRRRSGLFRFFRFFFLLFRRFFRLRLFFRLFGFHRFFRFFRCFRFFRGGGLFLFRFFFGGLYFLFFGSDVRLLSAFFRFRCGSGRLCLFLFFRRLRFLRLYGSDVRRLFFFCFRLFFGRLRLLLRCGFFRRFCGDLFRLGFFARLLRFFFCGGLRLFRFSPNLFFRFGYPFFFRLFFCGFGLRARFFFFQRGEFFKDFRKFLFRGKQTLRRRFQFSRAE